MGEVDTGKKQGALGTTGRRKGEEPRLSSLFPLPSVPRALSFTLSPASKLPTRPSAKEAFAEERADRPYHSYHRRTSRIFFFFFGGGGGGKGATHPYSGILKLFGQIVCGILATRKMVPIWSLP